MNSRIKRNTMSSKFKDLKRRTRGYLKLLLDTLKAKHQVMVALVPTLVTLAP